MAVSAPETPTPPQPARVDDTAASAASSATSEASRDTGRSQRARTGGLAAPTGQIAGENLQRGADQDDRRREHERVEALGPERPQHDPDDQAGGDGEDQSHAGAILA